MKWGATQLMISMFVWSLLVGLIVHHVETKPQAKRSRKSRVFVHARPSSTRRRTMRESLERPIIEENFSIDVTESESWPSWLQERYKNEIADKKISYSNKVCSNIETAAAPGKYDTILNLFCGVIDERMKKKEMSYETQTFRAGRGKKRDTTGGVVDDVANVLVNYKKQKLNQQKIVKKSDKSLPTNPEFVQELSQFLIKYNHGKLSTENIGTRK